MSQFPSTGTLKKKTIPAAAMELVQRAYDAKSSAPDGVVISAVYQQNVAEIQLTIPTRVAFLGGGRSQLMPHFIYGGEKKNAPLAGWLLDYVDFDGTPYQVSYSSALISLVTALNEAERRGAGSLDSNVGVTVAKYDDELQQFIAEIYLPIDMAARDSSGEVFAESLDYVNNVNYAELLEVLTSPDGVEESVSGSEEI